MRNLAFGQFINMGHVVLVSRDLYKHIDEFSVEDPNIISDHSILRFTRPISVANEEIDTQEDVFESVTYKYVRKSDNIDSFKINLSNSYGVLNGIQERLTTEQINNECIDEAVDVLVNTLENCAYSFRKDLFNPKAGTNTSFPGSQQKRHPWYTETCREKKLIFYEFLTKFRKDRSERNRLNMVQARSIYKNTLRRARFEFNCNQTYKLKMLKYKNAKDYWKLLKGAFSDTKSNVKSTKTLKIIGNF